MADDYADRTPLRFTAMLEDGRGVACLDTVDNHVDICFGLKVKINEDHRNKNKIKGRWPRGGGVIESN